MFFGDTGLYKWILEPKGTKVPGWKNLEKWWIWPPNLIIFGVIGALWCGKCVVSFNNHSETFTNIFMGIYSRKIFFGVHWPPLTIHPEIWRWQFMLYMDPYKKNLESGKIDFLYMKWKLTVSTSWCNLNKHDGVSGK